MMIDLREKVAIVTGASSGIGSAIAKKLGSRGAKVVINYLTNEEGAKVTASWLTGQGYKAVIAQGDVRDPSDAKQLVKTAIDTYGRLDILVNNAGVTRDNLLARMKEEDRDLVYDTILKGAHNMTKAATRPMLKQKSGGRIINISSISGIGGMTGQANYSTAKAGLVGFTKAIAKELGPRQITSNAVAPGLVRTKLTESLDEERFETAIKLTPLGRLGELEEIANVVAMLASNEASFVTGQVIRVDGGIPID